MSAAHFLDNATFYEVKAFLDGAAQRIYDDYNRTRLLMFTIMKGLGSKAESPTDILKLDGDPKETKKTLDTDEIERIREMVRNKNIQK